MKRLYRPCQDRYRQRPPGDRRALLLLGRHTTAGDSTRQGMERMNAIQTINLTKKFDKFVANDRINLAVEKNEIKCIVGENGAGKTTLMNMSTATGWCISNSSWSRA